MPHPVNYLNQTFVFEWYVIGCGSKTRYKKDMRLEEIGLHSRVQDIIAILGPKGGTSMTI
jgi:hypothetical protein